MMSLLGCSPDELGGVLKALGFRLDRRPVKVTPPAPCLAGSGTRPSPTRPLEQPSRSPVVRQR